MRAHDITGFEGTYSKELSDHIEEINDAYRAGKTAGELRDLVTEIVGPAADTPAKRKFLLNLNKQRTSLDVLMFVTNAMLRGAGMGTNVNDKFDR